VVGGSRAAQSIRDWGRDCWCPPGQSNTCGKRFEWQLGDLPWGYDHKYIFSNLGYNLKVTDMQAAIGLAQLENVPESVAQRRANFQRLHEGLQRWEDRSIDGIKALLTGPPVGGRDGWTAPSRGARAWRGFRFTRT